MFTRSKPVVPTGGINLEVTGPGGTTVLTANNLSGLNHSLMTLDTGVYWLRLTAVGSQPVEVLWTLKPVALDYEKIIENGVGQAPVLTVTLFGSVGDGQASASLGAANGVTDAVASGTSGAGSSGTTLVASPLPSSLLLVSMDAGLMGMPGASAQQVAVVGPTVEGALVSVADRVNGLLPGIRYGSGSDSEWRVGNGEPMDAGSANGSPVSPQEPGSLAAAAKLETVGVRDDSRVLAQVDRLLGLVGGFPGEIIPSWLGWRSNASRTSRASNLPEMPPPADLLAHSPRRNRQEHLIEADLTIPLSVIVATAIAYRMKKPLQKRLGHKAQPFVGPRRPHLFSGRGPHSPTFRVRMADHARLPRRTTSP